MFLFGFGSLSAEPEMPTPVAAVRSVATALVTVTECSGVSV
jgi:hypothetical protein